ncbi:hypothetical protein AYO50_01955 [Acidobacteria bacterium SCGC AG-212-P17]|nr:hypothetical protein AYO50_01955 [Acidobacteria bacterium SCGC AG-212-P17]
MPARIRAGFFSRVRLRSASGTVTEGSRFPEKIEAIWARDRKRKTYHGERRHGERQEGLPSLAKIRRPQKTGKIGQKCGIAKACAISLEKVFVNACGNRVVLIH